MTYFQYEFTDHGYVVKDKEEQFLVLEINGFENELTKHYRELLSQKYDLDRANAYLDQMFFGRDSKLIDGALINSAIQLLVRCFTKTSREDRIKFDEVKVFGKYAESIGEERCIDQYRKFYDIRNKVLSHDELNYHNNIVGITVDLCGNAQDIASITVNTHYVYKENRELLKHLINIAYKFAEEQVRNVEEILIEKYNACEPKPLLHPIDISKLGSPDSWNSW